MATTSLSLGPHWEGFVREQVASGRYATASEVVRAALRELEARAQALDALRAHLDEGAAQAARGELTEGFDVEDVIARTRARAQAGAGATGGARG